MQCCALIWPKNAIVHSFQYPVVMEWVHRECVPDMAWISKIISNAVRIHSQLWRRPIFHDAIVTMWLPRPSPLRPPHMPRSCKNRSLRPRELRRFICIRSIFFFVLFIIVAFNDCRCQKINIKFMALMHRPLFSFFSFSNFLSSSRQRISLANSENHFVCGETVKVKGERI